MVDAKVDDMRKNDTDRYARVDASEYAVFLSTRSIVENEFRIGVDDCRRRSDVDMRDLSAKLANHSVLDG